MNGKRRRWLRDVWEQATKNVTDRARADWYWKKMKKMYRPGMTKADIVRAVWKQYPISRV